MSIRTTDDAVAQRIRSYADRERSTKAQDLYFYNQPVETTPDGSHVLVRGRRMGMYASYSYLGLIGHPRINAAARAAWVPVSSPSESWSCTRSAASPASSG